MRAFIALLVVVVALGSACSGEDVERSTDVAERGRDVAEEAGRRASDVAERGREAAEEAAERAGGRAEDVIGGVKVSIKGFAFNPQTVEAKLGAKVTWVNEDTTAHTVTSQNKVFDSGKLENSKSFEFRFLQKGEFPYYCDIHGAASMSGVVRVT